MTQERVLKDSTVHAEPIYWLGPCMNDNVFGRGFEHVYEPIKVREFIMNCLMSFSSTVPCILLDSFPFLFFDESCNKGQGFRINADASKFVVSHILSNFDKEFLTRQKKKELLRKLVNMSLTFQVIND